MATEYKIGIHPDMYWEHSTNVEFPQCPGIQVQCVCGCMCVRMSMCACMHTCMCVCVRAGFDLENFCVLTGEKSSHVRARFGSIHPQKKFRILNSFW